MKLSAALVALVALISIEAKAQSFSTPVQGTAEARSAFCINNAAYDGGLASLYCLGLDSSSDLQFLGDPTKGASDTINFGSLNVQLDGGLAMDMSGRNGAAVSSQQSCEVGELTVVGQAAADAGFKRTFNTAPSGCQVSIISQDAGTVPCDLAQNISTTGLALTSDTNRSCKVEYTCCGN